MLFASGMIQPSDRFITCGCYFCTRIFFKTTLLHLKETGAWLTGLARRGFKMIGRSRLMT
jgi:hypothetical protein